MKKPRKNDWLFYSIANGCWGDKNIWKYRRANEKRWKRKICSPVEGSWVYIKHRIKFGEKDKAFIKVITLLKSGTLIMVCNKYNLT